MPDFSTENSLWKRGVSRVAGVDEAGRGPLAGPVVAAAVVLPKGFIPPESLNDSKQMSQSQREASFEVIKAQAISYRVALATPSEVDRLNILAATLVAMKKAVAGLKPQAEYALVDGNKMPALSIPAETIVGGDGKSISIAAASVLAKVTRDRMMIEYAKAFPHWGFEQHKGYGTKAHYEAIQTQGLSPIHRVSFRFGKITRPHALGKTGELLAQRHLEKKGYRFEARNFRCEYGEIDLIALDGLFLVFIEVKTRASASGLHPSLSVGATKQSRTRRAGEHYWNSREGRPLQPRFDVVSIITEDKEHQIEHLENAF